jgi:hypothetical protein
MRGVISWTETWAEMQASCLLENHFFIFTEKTCARLNFRLNPVSLHFSPGESQQRGERKSTKFNTWKTELIDHQKIVLYCQEAVSKYLKENLIFETKLNFHLTRPFSF